MNFINCQTIKLHSVVTPFSLILALFVVMPASLFAQKATDVSAGKNKNAAAESSDTGNIRISVITDELEEAIQVTQRKDGRIDVTYTNAVGGKSKVKKYSLKNIEKLAEKNKEAFSFYQRYANTNKASDTDADSGRNSVTKTGFSQSKKLGFPSLGSNNQAENSMSDSSSSSAWQSSTSSNINGRVRESTKSGTTGDGVVGNGKSKLQVANQIREMMNNTDNAEMKRALQELLEQVQNDRR